MKQHRVNFEFETALEERMAYESYGQTPVLQIGVRVAIYESATQVYPDPSQCYHYEWALKGSYIERWVLHKTP